MPDSPNMNLPIPVTSVTPGPEWATLIVNCLNLIDAHDHTPGNGVPITPGAMDITSDLSMGSNSLTDTKSIEFTSQAIALVTTDTAYVLDGDLYYVDGDGNNIQITADGAVAGSPGNIAGLVSPASATFIPSSGKFKWEQDTNIAADMDFASAIMRNSTPNSTYALTLKPPAALAANYSITLPALPASEKFLSMDNNGIMYAHWAVDGSTLEIAGGTTLQVKTGGITTTQILDATILGGDIAAATITGSNIAAQTITGSNVASNTLGSTQLAGTVGGISGKVSWASGTGSYANVTGLAVTATMLDANTRPIHLTVIPATDGTLAYVHQDNGDFINWRILRDGSTVVGSGSYTISGGFAALPVSGIHCLDVSASPGSHTYQVQFLCTGGSGITAGTLFVYQPQV